MNRFLAVVNATSGVVQNCRAAKFLLYQHGSCRGFAADEERKNNMYSLLPPDHLTENVVTCNANSRSANQWHHDLRLAGITNIVHLRAGKGGSEQVVSNSSQNVQCVQNYRTFPDPWCYTCYVPRNEIVEIPRPPSITTRLCVVD
jgi:hypothetical protein